MNEEVYDVGTVLNENNSNAISNLAWGVIGAVLIGLMIALVVIFHLKKKKKGEEKSSCIKLN